MVFMAYPKLRSDILVFLLIHLNASRVSALTKYTIIVSYCRDYIPFQFQKSNGELDEIITQKIHNLNEG